MACDVWIAGFRKKAQALASKRDCSAIGEWLPSISNHMYWCASSSGGSSSYGDLVAAKWLSVCNHMQNIHSGHGELFPECQHETLSDRKWLQPRETVIKKDRT